LVRFVRKARAGAVAPPRPTEEATTTPEKALPTSRHRVPVRPNPPRPEAPVSPLTPEGADVIRGAAERIEADKQRQRERAQVLRARLQATTTAPGPYQTTEAPLVMRSPDGIRFADRQPPGSVEVSPQRKAQIFLDAEVEGIARWFDQLDWLDELEPYYTPTQHASLRKRVLSGEFGGLDGYGIAIVGRATGLVPGFTYALAREGVAIALVVVGPAEYARYRAGWDQGRDWARRKLRRAGLAE
jgi:hypothetical protein